MLTKQYETQQLIRGCIEKRTGYYKLLYRHFYSFAMSICIRYSGQDDEAKTILNNGFMAVFASLHTYTEAEPFKSWLQGIMINAALDFYHEKSTRCDVRPLESIEAGTHINYTVLNTLSYETVLDLVRQLSLQQRLVFTLHGIDRYAHAAIAQLLHISEATSEATFLKARQTLSHLLANCSLDASGPNA